MKTKALLAGLFLAIGMVAFAGEGEKPKVCHSVKEVSVEIKDCLQPIPVAYEAYLDKEYTCDVYFKVDSDNQLEIVNVVGQDKELAEYVKSQLKKKTIKLKDFKREQLYKLPLKVVVLH